MTIKDVQELVDAWAAKSPARHRNELMAMAFLTEEVGELARVIAERHSNPALTPDDTRAAMSDELSDVLWALVTLANRAGIDLTEALIENLEKKNRASARK